MQTDYTQSARKALKLAERAAKACHHSYVGLRASAGSASYRSRTVQPV